MIEWLEKHTTPCFFKSNYNFECPGCGMQRAFIALMKGDIAESFSQHPALIPLIIASLVSLFYMFFKWEKGVKHIVFLFSFTVLIFIVNYLVKIFQAKV